MPENHMRRGLLSSYLQLPRYKQLLFPLTMLLQYPACLLVQGGAFYQNEVLRWSQSSIFLMQAFAGIGVVTGGWLGGQIAHRKHPLTGIKIGAFVCILTGSLTWYAAHEGIVPLYVIAIGLFALGQAVVWAPQEQSVMNAENSDTIQGYVGTYNLLWSIAAALALFSASPLLHRFGSDCFFLIPILCYLLVLTLTICCTPTFKVEHGKEDHHDDGPLVSVETRVEFRRLGWLCNPLSCLALTVLIAFSPKICEGLHLSSQSASSWSSIWFYVRAATFVLLGMWPGWRYNKPILFASFALLMASFAVCILYPNLQVFIVAQVFFGCCVGLIYQSSLYYSMAGSDSQAEHGGIHEMVIGLGLTVGPICGWLGSTWMPGDPRAVVGLTLLVLSAGLLRLLKSRKSVSSA